MDNRALESFLGFWADAGVECAFEETPQDRMLALVRPPTRDLQPAPGPLAAPQAASAPDWDLARSVAEVQSLDALEAAIAQFDGCPLKFQGASRAVFARGRPDAPIMIIGEAPGGDEDRIGAPFVGRAGKLLDQMLLAAGLLEDVFITNTVFWRPPGNRTPTAEEQWVCRPFLERAIGLVRPRLLVLVGGAATKSMLNTQEGILAIRGRWTPWSSSDGALEILALPTLHPAFLLRQPLAKKKAWADFLSLKQMFLAPH